MTNEILDGADMIRQFFGERQRFAHQTRNTWPQRGVEAFDVIGFARFFVMALCRAAGITPVYASY